MKATFQVTQDFTKEFNEIIKKFKNDSVLVGIPEEKGERREGTINNATLLAINHFGSPARNIPARPVMRVGIRNAQDAIAEEFKKAAQTVLSQGKDAIKTYYERAGMIAANSVKKAINDQDFDGAPGPSPATLRARKYIGKTGFKGTKSLIVTGQMRNSITFVLKEG